MERLEEFTLDGKNFIYIDFSELKENEEFIKISKTVEPIIAKYPPMSLYTITNVENIRFDSGSKEIVANYMRNNKPYVKHGAVIGLDGIKKIMISSLFKLSGRGDLHFAFSKEQAVEWLLEQD